MSESAVEQPRNDYVNAQAPGSATKRPVITGYIEQIDDIAVPMYLSPPSKYLAPFRDFSGSVNESGMLPSQGQINRGVQPQYETQEVLLESLSDMMVNNPDEYRVLEEQLKDTRFGSWESFFDAASRQDRPWDEYLFTRAAYDRQYDRGRGGGPSSQTNLSSESQAGALLDQAFTQYLGRTASDEEVKVWQELLNQAQRANPTRNSGGANNVTTGGFDPTRFAREYAQSQEGYAERFAAVTFMDALDAALANRGNYMEQFAKGEQ